MIRSHEVSIHFMHVFPTPSIFYYFGGIINSSHNQALVFQKTLAHGTNMT